MVDGLVRIKPLMKAVSDRAMNAVAVTDHCNMFAVVKVFKAALEAGVKPIFGAEIICSEAENPHKTYALVLLCKNIQGYKNLICLISKAYQEGQYQGQPRIQYEWLKDHTQGLIALSGSSVIQAFIDDDDAKASLITQNLSALFPGHFYLEIQRTGRKGEAQYNEKLVSLAEKLHLPLVATNTVCFLNEEDFYAHEARVCIHQGVTLADLGRSRKYTQQQYLKSAKEMKNLFQDLPQAIENTVEIARRCTVKLDLGNNYLPNFPTPDGSAVSSYLSIISKEGLEQRLKRIHAAREPYDKRLQLELEVINSMGFAGYFLIVADFIQWAKSNGVPVGPGRGSGAGSLVAYALNITDLDPLEYELLFERFLNPERVSMPDFDIDFCMEGRDRVIEYVAQKYGRQSVSQIITFGTMAAKAVVRDVGRVLGHAYGFVDKIAKLIPFELGITLKKALEDEEELKSRYENEEEVKELIDLALKLEGITRNAGKHAGGVVIAPSQLTDFTPIYCEEGSNQLLSQYDKDDVESAGLVKFDFLGLRTLTIIDWALQTINNQKAEEVQALDINLIPMDDIPTFDLLKACKTTAVFQLESRGMKELIHRLQPDNFEEIIALVALFRPGPLQSGMVDDFINRKHKRAKVEYPHPDLEAILKPTYGVILYQEQVMQIAQTLANFTLGAADLLRRAMGKKKPEEMAQQRIIFVEGAAARGVSEDIATHIFDLMEKFAGYGFNKSHSAAYALVAYQTAWLKAHYPAAFMAAVMSSDMDNTDKVVTFITEAEQLQINIQPPSIVNSEFFFTVADQKTIVYGLGAIKGLGESAVLSIVTERKNGEYKDLFDFCARLDLRKVNRRVLEVLIKSGAMDIWGVERSVLFASLEKALKLAENHQKNQDSGQRDLFSLFEEATDIPEYIICKPWTSKQRLEAEKEVLGLFISGHPSDQYVQELQKITIPIGNLNPQIHKKVLVCGFISNIKRILTKRGKKLIILSLEDKDAKVDVVVFSEVYESLPEPLQVGNMQVVGGEISQDDFSGGVKMLASQILSMEEARSLHAKHLSLILTPDHLERLPALQALLKEHKGTCVIQVQYETPAAKAALHMGTEWRINPTDRLISLLSDLIGQDKVSMCY
jgi:DNA polymerase-3 subunit alpha